LWKANEKKEREEQQRAVNPMSEEEAHAFIAEKKYGHIKMGCVLCDHHGRAI
jgi:hypothetical protein